MTPNPSRRRARSITAGAGAALVVLSAAACGSTVRNAHEILAQRAQAGYDSGALGNAPTRVAPTASAPGVAGGNPSASTGAGDTAAGAVVTPGAARGTRRGATQPPTSTTTPTNAPKHHAAVFTGPAKLAPVEVGVAVSQDVGQFAKLFGGTADVGNLETDSNAVIAYINKHGGFAGHVVRPVYYSIQLTSTQPYSTTMAAICSSWTEDHKVAAGIAVGFNIPNDLAQCLSAKHIPYLSGGNYLHDSTSYQQIPYLISPYEAGTDEVMSALLPHLLNSGWLTAKSHVGVLLASNETAAVRAYNNVIVPELKGRVAAVTQYGVNFPPSTQAAVATSQTISNDELHARANGVTNVIFLAPGAEGSFIDDAYQQKWFPKYAITSFDTPWAGTLAHNKEERATLAGSIGIGWQPTMDVGTYGNNVFTNPVTRTCNSILKPTGQLTSNVREFAGYQFCDALLSVQAAANASGAASVVGPAILAGYNALGTSHPDAMTFAERIDAHQHNGASAFRPLTYSPSCSCFRYTGGLSSF
ncbi:MAG TPA: hypothetical protein VHC43_05180 [Mycobacteriales bacterium]|nr:hypothetical protein [Mycobacteriales bacterium]